MYLLSGFFQSLFSNVNTRVKCLLLCSKFYEAKQVVYMIEVVQWFMFHIEENREKAQTSLALH